MEKVLYNLRVILCIQGIIESEEHDVAI